jgi:hypothetical protein
VVQESPSKKNLENTGSDRILAQVGGEGSGLPFLAFLDPAGNLIINSRRPVAGKPAGQNVGHPWKPEEIDHFMTMLRQAVPAMPPSDLGVLETWLRGQQKQ